MADFADIGRRYHSEVVLGYALGAKASGYVSVSVGGEQISVMADRDTTYAASDPVIILKQGTQWVALGRYGTAAPTQPDIDIPPPPKPPTPVSGSLVVPPTFTRSYRNSKWRDDNSDVYQGQYGGNGNHTGCVFYGSKPRSLDGATVTSATIKVRRVSGGDFAKQTSTMRLLTAPTKPGTTAPTLSSTTTGPRLAVNTTENSFTIPTSWAQAMVDGTAEGLAFFDSNGSPYIRFAGKSAWSSAFIMTIRYTR